MSGQIIHIRSIALAVPLLVWGVTIVAPTTPARAVDCFSAPHSAAPQGSHWYYYMDRAKRRKCWFLGPPGQLVRHTAAKVTATTVANASALEKAATAAAGALMSTSAGGSAPPLPPLKPQPAPMTGATTNKPDQQRVQEITTATSIPDAPGARAPLESTSSQTSAQAAAAAPAATIVWPDPTAVATVATQKPNLVRGDAPVDSVLPTVDVRALDNSEGAARDGASTTDAPSMAASPVATFVILVVALGVTVAGLLYRVVTKIAARRGRRIIIDHDQHQHEWRDDRQQHGSIYEGEEVIDNLHPSLVPAVGGHSARRPLRAHDECQNKACGKDSASQITDEVSGRENTLALLILELDRMLQSRKGA
jgi:hypothetical protein